MTSEAKLKASPRTVLGKKVKTLRRQGLLPGHVFGAQTEPINISVNAREFARIYQDVGETGLVGLEVEGEGQSRSVLVAGLDLDPVKGAVRHVDFHQVVMTEEVEVDIPLVINEEDAPAVMNHQGIILIQLDEVAIKALPGDIPDQIEVDLTGLENVGDTIYVKDLVVPGKIQLMTDEDQVVVAVEPVISEKMEEVIEEVEPEEVEVKPTEKSPTEEAGDEPEGGRKTE